MVLQPTTPQVHCKMTSPMTNSTLGSLPYDDVYLDQISSDDEDEEEIDENVNISLKPLMSPRKRPKVFKKNRPSNFALHTCILVS